MMLEGYLRETNSEAYAVRQGAPSRGTVEVGEGCSRGRHWGKEGGIGELGVILFVFVSVVVGVMWA